MLLILRLVYVLLACSGTWFDLVFGVNFTRHKGECTLEV